MIAFPELVQDPADRVTVLAPAPSENPPSAGQPISFLHPHPHELERLGDEIARLAAHLHAATYQLLVLIRTFDEQEGWSGGFLSCAHWLSWRTGIGPGPAREKVRVARALGTLPRLSQAMAQGQLSYSKVRGLTRVATTENEAELLEVARHATAAQLERLIRSWRYVDRLEEEEKKEEKRCHRSRFLQLFPDVDGSYVLRGRLDPEAGALLEKALEWAEEELYRKETAGSEAERDANAEPAETQQPEATADQRRADAMGLMAERAMSGSTSSKATRADRFQVVVHVEASGQAVMGKAGVGVSAETSRRLACDSGMVIMTHDSEGLVLDVGRRRRTVPPALRRALEHRDGGCRFPGCGCRFTDAHHIRHWADGGETNSENLVLLCRRHHRVVHEQGFQVEAEMGEVRFLGPDGRVIPEVPESPRLSTDPVGALIQRHGGQGIVPDRWTPTPDWHGETLDYGLAIDMLRRPRRKRDR